MPIIYNYYDTTYHYIIPLGIFELTKYSDYGILYLRNSRMYFIMDTPYANITIHILNNLIIKTEIYRGTNASSETIRYYCSYRYPHNNRNLLAIRSSGISDVANDSDYDFEVTTGSSLTVLL